MFKRNKPSSIEFSPDLENPETLSNDDLLIRYQMSGIRYIEKMGDIWATRVKIESGLFLSQTIEKSKKELDAQQNDLIALFKKIKQLEEILTKRGIKIKKIEEI